MAVGFLDGLLLTWIRPSPRDTPLVAQAATELIVLPLQIWLWLVVNPMDFLPLVVAPSVVSIGVAALLGRRLPPAPGPGGNRSWRRAPVIAGVAQWRSIEVMHGRGSAFRWQEQHDSALIEAALASRARDGAWHADQWGVVFEVRFGTGKEWKAFRARPAVRTALDAVPDPAGGLFVYRGRSGSATAAPVPARDSGPAGRREETLIRRS